MTNSSRTKKVWSEYCESQGFENYIELIGTELLIIKNKTVSFQKILVNLKKNYESLEEGSTVIFRQKKKLYQLFRQDLVKMQNLGLVTIESKIDSSRYIVHFNWLENYLNS